MKTYTGFGAIVQLEKHILKKDDFLYRFNKEEGVIEFKRENRDKWNKGILDFEKFIKYEYELYVEPLKLEEGEMAVLEASCTGDKWYFIYTGETNSEYRLSFAVTPGDWYVFGRTGSFNKSQGTFRKVTDEELQEFERFMVFHKKGREMDEFQLGDVVEREDTLYKVFVQTEDNKFEGVIGCVAINEKGAPVKYFPANSMELQFCVDDMVG